MIETEVTVAAIRDGQAWVIPARNTSACGSCAGKEGCGVSVWQKLLPGSRRGDSTLEVAVATGVTADVGDRAIVSLAESAYLRAMLRLYLLPLLLLLLAAALMTVLGFAEPWVILAGVAGLLAGLLLVRWLPLRSAAKPTLVRVIASAAAPAQVKLAL